MTVVEPGAIAITAPVLLAVAMAGFAVLHVIV